MAAPLRSFVKYRFLEAAKKVCILPAQSYAHKPRNPKKKHKFYYPYLSEDSAYSTGERPVDRYINVPKKVKPHPETPVQGQYELDPPKGKIYDKKPFPINLVAGKKYKWCICGHSKTQPMCDSSHKEVYMADLHSGFLADKVVLHHPITFEVEKDGEYWLCNCKQSSNRPFCDGTHRQEYIQSKIKN